MRLRTALCVRALLSAHARGFDRAEYLQPLLRLENGSDVRDVAAWEVRMTEVHARPLFGDDDADRRADHRT